MKACVGMLKCIGDPGKKFPRRLCGTTLLMLSSSLLQVQEAEVQLVLASRREQLVRVFQYYAAQDQVSFHAHLA